MSTLETNTEELQGILNTVYTLPDRSTDGSAEPDLVIGLNASNPKTRDDEGTGSRSLKEMTIDDVSIISGSVASVAEKVRQGLPVKVLLRDIHFYWDDLWYQNIGEANHVMVFHRSTYPSESPTYLCAAFYLSNMGLSATDPCYVRFSFDIATGAPNEYMYNRLGFE